MLFALTTMPSRFILTLAATVLAAGLASPALADAGTPHKPITLIVPYPPGGTNDNVARIVSRHLEAVSHRTVIVDYKAGAGGTIGAGFVAAASPDGDTLLNASIGNLAIAPQLIKTHFDPFVDLVPLAWVGSSTSAIAVNPKLPVHTLIELIAYARAHPGLLTYGTSGIGTPGHLAGEHLAQLANISIRHVPYRGSAAAVSDVVAGHVDIVIDPLATPFIKAGKLRALAFFGAPNAPAELAGVPTVAQAGLKDWNEGVAGAFLIAAPRRAPPDVLARLRAQLDAILREPETIRELAAVQVIAEPISPDEAEHRLHAVHDLAQRFVSADGMRPD